MTNMDALFFPTISMNDEQLVKTLELAKRRARHWKRKQIYLSFTADLIKSQDEDNIILNATPELKVVLSDIVVERYDALADVDRLSRWLKRHFHKVRAKVHHKPLRRLSDGTVEMGETHKAKRVKKRRLLVGLTSVELLRRHPDERTDERLGFKVGSIGLSV